MMTVMDHTGHKSLATRQRLLDRFLPDDYGTAVMNKTAILTQGEHELELHAGLVQSDIELAKKQHTRTTRMADGTARRPGKLNRIRDTFGGKVEGAARVEEEKEEKEEPSAVSPMKGPKSAKVAPSDLKPAVSAASVSFVLKGAASPSSKSPLGAKPLKK